MLHKEENASRACSASAAWCAHSPRCAQAWRSHSQAVAPEAARKLPARLQVCLTEYHAECACRRPACSTLGCVGAAVSAACAEACKWDRVKGCK